jgi:hypothetical protein
MSVVLVKGSELCKKCVMVCHPHEGPPNEGSLRCFIEMNDLCTECLNKRLVVRYPFNAESRLVRRVESRSPWLRREARRQFLRKVEDAIKDPYAWSILAVFLMAAFLWVVAIYGIWSYWQ